MPRRAWRPLKAGPVGSGRGGRTRAGLGSGCRDRRVSDAVARTPQAGVARGNFARKASRRRRPLGALTEKRGARRTQERGAVRGLRTCAGRGFGWPVSWPGLLGSIVRLPSAVAPLAPRDGSRRATSLTLKSGHRAFQWPGRFSPAAPLRVKCGCTVAQTRRCRSREDNDHTQGLDTADAPDVLTGRPEPRHRAANPRNP